MNNLLTLITPIKITTDQEFQYLSETLESYYSIMTDRPKHLFAVSMNNFWYNKVLEILTRLNCNFEILTFDQNAIDAFITLIRNVNTKFCFMMFGDVLNVSQKDILSVSVKALTMLPNVCQIRLGGYPIGDFNNFPYNNHWGSSDFTTNLSHFEISDNTSKFVYDSNCVFNPITVSKNDTIWKHKMNASEMKFLYPLPFWHTVMRTDVAKNFVRVTESKLTKQDKTIIDFLVYGNSSKSVTTNTICTNGYPKDFEFIEQYEEGFLNFACYLYMLGREKKSISQFQKDHCNESY